MNYQALRRILAYAVFATAAVYCLSGCALLLIPGLVEGSKQAKIDREQRQAAEAALIRQIRSGASAIPIDRASSLLVDSFNGRACGGRVPVEIKIFAAEVPRLQYGLYLYGQFVLPGRSGRPTYLQGYFYPTTGELYLAASRPPSMTELKSRYLGEFEARTIFGLEFSPQNQAKLDKRYGAKIPVAYADSEPPTTVAIIAARNSSSGWSGAFSAAELADCNDIAFSSSTGRTTDLVPDLIPERSQMLPSVGANRGGGPFFTSSADTAEKAKRLHDLNAKIAWSQQLASRGNREANMVEAALLEARAEATVPANYRDALSAYKRVAQTWSDARAQLAVGRLYMQGLGTLPDEAEAQKWMGSAQTRLLSAGGFCSSTVVVKSALMLLAFEDNDPGLRAWGALASLATGLRVSSGEVQVLSVTLKSFIAPDLPFECEVSARTVGKTFSNHRPLLVYSRTEPDGSIVYTDNSVELAIKDASVALASAMSGSPYERRIKVVATGPRAFQVTLVRKYREASKEYSIPIQILVGEVPF
jgi:hypothetical protein